MNKYALLARSRAPRPALASLILIVLLVGGLAMSGGTGLAAPRDASTVPSKLVGQWTRKITSADVRRAGGVAVLVGSVCTLTVKKSGAARLDCTKVGVFEGSLVAAETNRVHINLGDPTPNVYGWRVSGRLLTLTKLKDATPDRAAAMWGVWKRT